MTYLFGPRLNLRKFDYFVPFAEFLAGGAHGGTDWAGRTRRICDRHSGGVDIVLTKNFSWRVAQLGLSHDDLFRGRRGASGRQNNFRAATGIVCASGFRIRRHPDHSPVAACSVDPRRSTRVRAAL